MENPSILAKLDFPDPKKPDTHIANTLVRLVRRLLVRVENAYVVRANRVRYHILINFVSEDLLIGLVNFDDLFDPALNVAGEKSLDQLASHDDLSRIDSSKNLRPVVVFRVQNIHETKSRSAIERTGVKENRRNENTAF